MQILSDGFEITFKKQLLKFGVKRDSFSMLLLFLMLNVHCSICFYKYFHVIRYSVMSTCIVPLL
jgi:hypothetical protein